MWAVLAASIAVALAIIGIVVWLLARKSKDDSS